MSKPDNRNYVTRERDRQIREAVKGEREIAKRASVIAENTSAYDAQKAMYKAKAKPKGKR